MSEKQLAGVGVEGYAIRFDSWGEGHADKPANPLEPGAPFIERYDRQAFMHVLGWPRGSVRSQWCHGKDPQVGEDQIGRLTNLDIDSVGVYYRIELFLSRYLYGLMAAIGEDEGLEASTVCDHLRWRDNLSPEPSEHNPDAVPERTVYLANLKELGPCPKGRFDRTSSCLVPPWESRFEEDATRAMKRAAQTRRASTRT